MDLEKYLIVKNTGSCDCCVKFYKRVSRIFRYVRIDLVLFLVVAGIREAVETPLHLGTRASLHRGFPWPRASPDGHAYVRHDTLAEVLDLHAGARHHRSQFLQVLEFLSPRAFPSSFYARSFRHGSPRGKFHLEIKNLPIKKKICINYFKF